MKMVGGTWSNWSGGVSCKPRAVISPKDDVELAAAVRKAEGRVRVLGSGHSFTPLNATDDTLIDLSSFAGLKGCDPEREVATIAAGTPLWGIGSLLHPMGFALKNMGDIDRQTLGGVVGTGTHGTGRTLGSFSADVASFRLLLANG
ncbi:MAG: FAD-binding protein, partial [Alphaproteobacteria bacterium]|nr:FAD-binding protein [Alphaproteobacteria bacterium]